MEPLVHYLFLIVQDFKGQQLADTMTEVLLSVFALVAFLVGYLCQNIFYTAIVMGAGSILVCLVGNFLILLSNDSAGCPPLAIFSSEPRKVASCQVLEEMT
jgi:Microsomal signal peptidase 12 kDa subunit (SPC12)